MVMDSVIDDGSCLCPRGSNGGRFAAQPLFFALCNLIISPLPPAMIGGYTGYVLMY